MPAPPTWRPPCISRTISGRTCTRPPTTARRGQKIVNGIPDNAFTRVVREDPNHKGLLVAGTEIGMFISFDDGENWQPFQLNLPVTPDHRPGVPQARAGTGGGARRAGRSGCWTIVPMLYQVHGFDRQRGGAQLFKPKDTYRFGGGGRGTARGAASRGRESAGRRADRITRSRTGRRAMSPSRFWTAPGKMRQQVLQQGGAEADRRGGRRRESVPRRAARARRAPTPG